MTAADGGSVATNAYTGGASTADTDAGSGARPGCAYSIEFWLRGIGTAIASSRITIDAARAILVPFRWSPIAATPSPASTASANATTIAKRAGTRRPSKPGTK